MYLLKNAAQEYKRYIEERSREMDIKRQERRETMEKVKRTAYNELRKKLDDANDEMRRHIEYRNTLNNQIRDDEKNLVKKTFPYFILCSYICNYFCKQS